MTSTHNSGNDDGEVDLMGSEDIPSPIPVQNSTFDANTPQPVRDPFGDFHDDNHVDQDNNDDDFGDFGSGNAVPTHAGLDDDDDGFGDFGTVQATTAEDGDADDNDDEFGDFGAAHNAGTGGGDDDEFGDFGDFGAVQSGGAEDDDFGDFGDFGGGGEVGHEDSDAFGDSSNGFEAPEPEQEPAQQEQVVPDFPVKIAPDFNAVNSLQVENYVLEQLASIFPVDESDKARSLEYLNDLEDQDASTILGEQELWSMLMSQAFQGSESLPNSNSNSNTVDSAPQFQWKYSKIRQTYYETLGMTVVNEQMLQSSSSASIPSLPTSSKSRISSLSSSLQSSSNNSPDLQKLTSSSDRKPMDLVAARNYCSFTRESLGSISGEQMKEIIGQLTEMTKQASEELTFWLDQREQLMMDSEGYNRMIANLVHKVTTTRDQATKNGQRPKRLTLLGLK